MSRTCVLVLAKAPIPGFAKTRLCPPATPRQAAELAAAALLDTLDTVLSTPDTTCVVALTGPLSAAARADELLATLRRVRVVGQRGGSLAERIAAAHTDAGRCCPGLPVLQIGMDTPQLTPALLAAAAAALHGRGPDAVLGPARDGGWWALGLRDPAHARALQAAPTSRPDTGARTLAGLRASGLRVAPLPLLSDVDTVDDAVRVAGAAPAGRFARVLGNLRLGGARAAIA